MSYTFDFGDQFFKDASFNLVGKVFLPLRFKIGFTLASIPVTKREDTM